MTYHIWVYRNENNEVSFVEDELNGKFTIVADEDIRLRSEITDEGVNSGSTLDAWSLPLAEVVDRIDYDGPRSGFKYGVIFLEITLLKDYESYTVEIYITVRTGELKWQVLDINDNPPIFPRNKRNITLGGLSTGLIIHFPRAVDKDSGVNAQTWYEVVGDSQFSLTNNKSSPTLVCHSSLTPLSPINLRVIAFDQLDIHYWSFMDIAITFNSSHNTPIQFYDVILKKVPVSGKHLITIQPTDEEIAKYGMPTYSHTTINGIYSLTDSGEITPVGTYKVLNDVFDVDVNYTNNRVGVYTIQVDTIKEKNVTLKWANAVIFPVLDVRKETTVIDRLSCNVAQNENSCVMSCSIYSIEFTVLQISNSNKKFFKNSSVKSQSLWTTTNATLIKAGEDCVLFHIHLSCANPLIASKKEFLYSKSLIQISNFSKTLLLNHSLFGPLREQKPDNLNRLGPFFNLAVFYCEVKEMPHKTIEMAEQSVATPKEYSTTNTLFSLPNSSWTIYPLAPILIFTQYSTS
ncbi:protocadherin gamma-A4-like [Octopus sinensis]|uniref:Protocadherin gamma-A4-like n=1 Tax=Octopus sinensis TaxID=2607531 RepID=A0A6P7TT65_9MOLL|nr:protocadherin gamma-A4-like [Octopus sinensis]